MTTLYRAVSRLEKQDFDRTGILRTGENTLEAKQFFKSQEAINEFVANAFYNSITRHMNIYSRSKLTLIILAKSHL